METEKIGLSKILGMTFSCSPDSMTLNQHDTYYIPEACSSSSISRLSKEVLAFNFRKLEIRTTCVGGEALSVRAAGASARRGQGWPVSDTAGSSQF